MREECKHFQSRTYKSGEVARFCVLGNAPDQPWSCPENCLTYERRFVDVGWSHGGLVDRPVESAPPDVPVEERRELLASASEIVNAIAPELIEERRRELEELEKKRRKGRKFWRR
jgi:predicted outer membrane lipoprotein